MARKFFNLFCIFHEENCRKYERLGIPYQHSGKIVTNRALPLLRNDISNHVYKKVVVADDIIIHGRTIREVYNELYSLCPDLDILLMSYARNDHDTTVYEDILDRMMSRYQIEAYERCVLSDEIVNTFYMAGRPYISYLPYFTLNIEWNRLKEELEKGRYLSIQNEDMRRFRIEAYVYRGRELDLFSGLRCCEVSALRFYYYPHLNKVIMIPYFCLHVIQESSLINLSDYIRNLYFEMEYVKLLKDNKGADGMRAMELEYTLSVWMGMYFMDKISCYDYVWNKEIEDYNFSRRLLSEQKYTYETIERMIDNLKQIDRDILFESVRNTPKNKEVSTLLKKYGELQEKYAVNFYRWNTMKWWKKERPIYEQLFIDDYLAINGMLDEERCQEGNAEKKRLFGVPVSYILSDMSDYLVKLYKQKKEKAECIMNVLAALIIAVDSGRGSIVYKTEEVDTSYSYNESVIYAGEQNYKFYDSTNFPIMYAFYLIEQESMGKDDAERVAARKLEMITKFTQFLEDEQIFYIEEEMLQISNINLSETYKKYLQNSYEKYSHNDVLHKAVTLAMDICNRN